jgi:hypothetical protein
MLFPPVFVALTGMGFLSQYNDLTLFEQIIFLICHMFYLQLFVEGLVPYCGSFYTSANTNNVNKT